MAEIDAIAVIQTSTQPTNTDVIWYLSNTASTKPSSKFSLYDHDSGIWTTIESMVTSAVSSVSGNGIYGGSGTLRTGVIVTMAGHSVKFSGGNVGIGSGAISESALLDLNAADKALLLPRLITPASVVTLPVNGMFAYDVTTNKFKGYENGAWVSFSTSSSGLESLNGLTASTQTIAVGTSGTDFAVVSAVSTHTFNLPTASAVNRGALSSADWTTFNGKLSAAITSLNGLTAASQSFAIGTAGTDFNIVFSGSTHTFNFPTASAVNRGLLSTADWSTFNGKQNALTFGDLTETTSAILTITGGTGAVIGSGVTVEVQQSSGAQDGFLSSTDWTTFNGKVSSITDGGADTSLIKTSGTATVLYRLLAGTNITLTPGADSITIDSAGGTDTNFANTDLTLAANRSHTLTGFTMALVGNQVNTFSVDGATFSVDAANNRIGVGTSSPTQGKIHISMSASEFYGLRVLTGTSNGDSWFVKFDSSTNDSVFYIEDRGQIVSTRYSSNAHIFNIATGTSGGINQKYNNANRMSLYIDDTHASITLFDSAPTSQILFSTFSGQNSYIGVNNFGVGLTTGISAKLHVVGSVYFQNTAQTVYGLAMDATTGFIGIGKSTASFNLDVLSSATAVKVETTSTSSANAGIFSQASGAGGARAVVGYATGAGNVALEAAQGASGTAVFVRMLADGVTGIDLADGVATGNTRRWITATLNDVTGSNNTLRALQFTRGQTASPANTFTGDFFYMNEANSNATGNLIKIVKNAVDQFLIKSTGVVSMPVTQIGNGGLSAGDLYKDTAANILANGDFVVGMKA